VKRIRHRKASVRLPNICGMTDEKNGVVEATVTFMAGAGLRRRGAGGGNMEAKQSHVLCRSYIQNSVSEQRQLKARPTSSMHAFIPKCFV
jgi:hypothetical protein